MKFNDFISFISFLMYLFLNKWVTPSQTLPKDPVSDDKQDEQDERNV